MLGAGQQVRQASGGKTVPEAGALGDAVDDVSHGDESAFGQPEQGLVVVVPAQLAAEQVRRSQQVGVCAAQVLDLGDPSVSLLADGQRREYLPSLAQVSSRVVVGLLDLLRSVQPQAPPLSPVCAGLAVLPFSDGPAARTLRTAAAMMSRPSFETDVRLSGGQNIPAAGTVRSRSPRTESSARGAAIVCLFFFLAPLQARYKVPSAMSVPVAPKTSDWMRWTAGLKKASAAYIKSS